MTRWLKRTALLALVGAGVRWILTWRRRRDRSRSGVAPTIGGDTWPPVPLKSVSNG